MPRAHYTSAYEKSKQRLAEEARERERRKTDLFTNVCPYTLEHGYQLNVNNTVIRQFYEHSKLGRPPFSDPQRRAWEACLWNFLRKQYMKHDRQYAKEIPIRFPSDQHMSKVLWGWRLEFFELFINNTLDVPTALELFAQEEAGIDYKKLMEVS